MWQIKELNHWMKKNKNDPALDFKMVFLSDPKKILEVEEIIIEKIWPGVEDALSSVPLLKPSIVIYGSPKENIQDKISEYISKELIFVLEDPKNPIGPFSNPSWYCRGKIECSPLDYMISFDFIVYFPDGFSLSKIHSLLKGPVFEGCPPELSYSRTHQNKFLSSVAFTKGCGAGFGLKTYADARNHLFEEMGKNLHIIERVYELEKDYTSSTKFNNLALALIEGYGES